MIFGGAGQAGVGRAGFPASVFSRLIFLLLILAGPGLLRAQDSGAAPGVSAPAQPVAETLAELLAEPSTSPQGSAEGLPQEAAPPKLSEFEQFEELLDKAMAAMEQGEWAKAYRLLDQAEELFPGDERVASYRLSFQELEALEKAQNSWNEGVPLEVDTGDAGTAPEDGRTETGPRFTLNRGARDPRESPVLTRHKFRAEMAVKLFASDPLTKELVNIWSYPREFGLTSLSVDVRYWMPFFRRILGFTLRDSGYSRRPGQNTFMRNTLDFGLNLRGFLLETKTSRMELGLDFGTSLLTSLDAALPFRYNPAFFLGLWVTDPVFYHLFNADSLERLIFGAGLRIYSWRAAELLEIINYRINGFWQMDHARFGLRLEWWRFSELQKIRSTFSLSVTAGYAF